MEEDRAREYLDQVKTKTKQHFQVWFKNTIHEVKSKETYKSKVKFEPFGAGNMSKIYIGATHSDAKNHLHKIGRTKNATRRGKTYNTGNSVSNMFIMENTYDVNEKLAHKVEQLIHEILKPFNLRDEASPSREIFMVNKHIADRIIERITNDVLKSTQEVDTYIDDLRSNNMNFDMIKEGQPKKRMRKN